MRRRTFVGALMAAAAVGFGLRRPVDPQPFLDYTRKAMREALWSTKMHQDGAVLTEEILLEAQERILNEPVRPMEFVISARTARRLYWMGYWR